MEIEVATEVLMHFSGFSSQSVNSIDCRTTLFSAIQPAMTVIKKKILLVI